MPISSPEYRNVTDDDVELWYHTRIANNKLDSLMNGYDYEDEELTSSELSKKYTGDILEQKSKKFSKLKVGEQKSLLESSVTGNIAGIAKEIIDAPAHNFLIAKVRAYMIIVRDMGKLNEWVKSASGMDFEKFCRFSLEEKKKYGNALIAYHDRRMEEKGRVPLKQVLDSSPTATGGRPDFDDKKKWQQV